MSNYPVNRTDFTVVQGVPQMIQFFIRDIDRQPLDGTGVTVTITISDPEAQQLLMQRDMVLQDATLALYGLSLYPNDILDWPEGPLRYSVGITRADGTQTLLWTDRDYTPYGYLQVIEGPVPGPLPAVVINPANMPKQNGWVYSSPLKVSGYAGAVQTFQIYTTNYSGNIRIQGSLEPQPDAEAGAWFDISSQEFSSITGVNSFTTFGTYEYVRVVIQVPETILTVSPDITLTNVTGTVDQILYKG